MQQVLNAPNPTLVVGRGQRSPWRELLGHCADIRPFAGASNLGREAGSSLKGVQCGRRKERGDHDEAITAESTEVGGGGGGIGVSHLSSLVLLRARFLVRNSE